MFGLFRSLRFRLVLMYLVIFGIIQVTLSAVGLMAAERELSAQFDRELLRRTQGMAEELIQSRRRLFPQPLPRVIDQQTSSIFFRDFYVQLRDGEGELIERSANLSGFQLPLAAQGTMRRGLQTIGGSEVESLVGIGQRLRLVTRRIEEPNMPPLILQVAASLYTLDAGTTALRRLFLVGVPIGLLAASVAAWWITGRTLRRIDEVSEFAQRATPERLTDQLPVPARDDEIGQMIRNVNQMLLRLKAGFDAQEHFLHDVSHELKTPLSVMFTEAQGLKGRQISIDAYRQFVEGVEQETRHLGRVIESLLLLTRADSRQAVLRRELASINDAVEVAVEECQPIARLNEVDIELQLAMPQDEGELSFCGDQELLSVLVSNLIRNAIRFSPVGRSIQVRVTRCDDKAAITVRDHGPGVPPELIDKVFDRFVQGPGGARHRGSGLGLTIADTVAKLHGGDITLANLDEGGCAFTATIPLCQASGASSAGG